MFMKHLFIFKIWYFSKSNSSHFSHGHAKIMYVTYFYIPDLRRRPNFIAIKIFLLINEIFFIKWQHFKIIFLTKTIKTPWITWDSWKQKQIHVSYNYFNISIFVVILMPIWVLIQSIWDYKTVRIINSKYGYPHFWKSFFWVHSYKNAWIMIKKPNLI